MSLWNFLGGFALFNVVCDMFSCKRNYVLPPEPYYRHRNYEDYQEFMDYQRDIDDDCQDELDDLSDEMGDMDFDCDDAHDDW